jgi:hypothetical protein
MPHRHTTSNCPCRPRLSRAWWEPRVLQCQALERSWTTWLVLCPCRACFSRVINPSTPSRRPCLRWQCTVSTPDLTAKWRVCMVTCRRGLQNITDDFLVGWRGGASTSRTINTAPGQPSFSTFYAWWSSLWLFDSVTISISLFRGMYAHTAMVFRGKLGFVLRKTLMYNLDRPPCIIATDDQPCTPLQDRMDPQVFLNLVRLQRKFLWASSQASAVPSQWQHPTGEPRQTSKRWAVCRRLEVIVLWPYKTLIISVRHSFSRDTDCSIHSMAPSRSCSRLRKWSIGPSGIMDLGGPSRRKGFRSAKTELQLGFWPFCHPGKTVPTSLAGHEAVDHDATSAAR